MYYDLSSSSNMSPYVGLKVTTLKEDDRIINWVFKDFNDLYYVIENDIIIAEATQQSSSNKIAVYTIDIVNLTSNQKVALFKGTVYKTDKNW